MEKLTKREFKESKKIVNGYLKKAIERAALTQFYINDTIELIPIMGEDADVSILKERLLIAEAHLVEVKSHIKMFQEILSCDMDLLVSSDAILNYFNSTIEKSGEPPLDINELEFIAKGNDLFFCRIKEERGYAKRAEMEELLMSRMAEGNNESKIDGVNNIQNTQMMIRVL